MEEVEGQVAVRMALPGRLSKPLNDKPVGLLSKATPLKNPGFGGR